MEFTTTDVYVESREQLGGHQNEPVKGKFAAKKLKRPEEAWGASGLNAIERDEG